jgi:carboxyl-terminal processing protease
VRKLRVQRRLVDVPSVQDSKILDTQFGVAYMKLTSFQKTTSRDVDAALWSLHRQGMRSLIIDVRGNPGGLLNASVEVADKFLTSGVIVSTRGRSTREDFDYQAHDAGTWRVPLVVLIDGDSASASEIFAGAVHDPGAGGRHALRKGASGTFHNRYSGIRHHLEVLFAQRLPISDHGVTPHVNRCRGSYRGRRGEILPPWPIHTASGLISTPCRHTGASHHRSDSRATRAPDKAGLALLDPSHPTQNQAATQHHW